MACARQLLVVTALFAAACAFTTEVDVTNEASELPSSFVSFISEYARTYTVDTKEYEMRRNLYEDRFAKVEQHNSNPHRRWTAAVNHLSDRTESELSQLRGLRIVQSATNSGRARGTVKSHTQFLAIKSSVLPAEKSWTHLKSAKLDVDQGGCGSCWAVATATMLAANAEIYGHNNSFSAQELVSCTPNPHNCGGSGGCGGATVELAMNWVMEEGLDTNTGTPYMGSDSTCKKEKPPTLLSGKTTHTYGGATLDQLVAVGFHGAKSQASAGLALGLHGWERLPENEYEPLMRAIAERGPVAVSVGASDWNSYSRGLFDSCSPDVTINHAVTLMGYGSEKEDKYWTIKNSWGLMWGEGGNIRLLREEGNKHCGTDYKPKDGTACDGGPETVPVCGMCGILYDNVVPHFKKL